MSAFLLANAIRYEPQGDVSAWVRAAQGRSSFLAAAVDHAPVAEILLRGGMATDSDGIRPSARLRAVSDQADRATLLAIAAMFLEISPPSWLHLAVVGDEVRLEVIPSADLDGLAWLEPELEQILRDAHPASAQTSGVLALGLGRAAELVIFAALEGNGASPVHVAEISDRFGYDIESTGSSPSLWEVKGCTVLTADRFHLTRNEYEVCRRNPQEWVLAQVRFDAAALVADEVSSAHIAGIRELRPSAVGATVPPDSDNFRWESSAILSPPESAWIESGLIAPAQFRVPSLDTLGREILEMRGSDRHL